MDSNVNNVNSKEEQGLNSEYLGLRLNESPEVWYFVKTNEGKIQAHKKRPATHYEVCGDHLWSVLYCEQTTCTPVKRYYKHEPNR